MAADMSGFCPVCRTWLGKPGEPDAATLDTLEIYNLWCSAALADLVHQAEKVSHSTLASFEKSIRQLISLHHGGVSAYFARQIGRNKSVVAMWLSGQASPRWEAMCTISYVYQVSLASLLTGTDCNGDAMRTPRGLPDAVLTRHIGARKKPTKRDRSQMVSLMESIQAGMHMEVTSMSQIADRLGVNVRDLYEMAPDVARKTSAALSQRAAQRKAERAARRAERQIEAARRVADELTRDGGPTSRRVVEAAMAKLGYVVWWEESKSVVDMISRQIALASPVSDLTSKK